MRPKRFSLNCRKFRFLLGRATAACELGSDLIFNCQDNYSARGCKVDETEKRMEEGDQLGGGRGVYVRNVPVRENEALN